MSGDSRARHGLLDTSTVIMLAAINDPTQLPHEPLIPAITLAELSVGPLVATSSEQRGARQAHLQQAEADFDPLPFDDAAARAFGQVAASLRRRGRRTATRAYDAMVAAVAIANVSPSIPAIRMTSRASMASRSSTWPSPLTADTTLVGDVTRRWRSCAPGRVPAYFRPSTVRIGTSTSSGGWGPAVMTRR